MASQIHQRSLCPCYFRFPCFKTKSTYDLIEEAKTGISSLVEIKQKQFDSLQVRHLQNTEKIKELAKVGNRSKAFQLFKSNKIIEKRMNVLQKYMENLETQQYNLDDTDTNTQMVYLMSTIKTAMKKAGVNMNIDDVADTVEDINDMNSDLNEVQEILSNNASHDDHNLEEEFEQLFNQDDDDNANINLPVPITDTKFIDLPKVNTMERVTVQKQAIYS